MHLDKYEDKAEQAEDDSVDLSVKDKKEWLQTKMERKLSVEAEGHWFKDLFYGKTMDYITSK